VRERVLYKCTALGVGVVNKNGLAGVVLWLISIQLVIDAIDRSSNNVAFSYVLPTKSWRDTEKRYRPRIRPGPLFSVGPDGMKNFEDRVCLFGIVCKRHVS
jgi:hypothetical protein